jgi:hypothetical protein
LVEYKGKIWIIVGFGSKVLMIMDSNSIIDNSNHHYILNTKPYLHYVMVAERTKRKEID